ncbi:TRAP transporter small permease subunit [Synechococcus sp. PCC 7336]|uniref:TRAP transporter small permease subunit n=1 Tax=Synechococcus sp. PCC 7336 TaxID=195250 RepID=UPI000348C09C|nr:TRAP transporter small permease subunit [Synechococcus sp. PCC 7336]
MQFLLKLSRWIDRLSEAMGWLTLGLTLVMVLVGSYNAIARYLGRFLQVNLSSNLYIEAQWYLFSLIFLLGASYVLEQNAHVRVDILYNRLSPKGKVWVNLIGSIFLLLPLCFVILGYSLPSVINSWQIWEQSSDPSGLPRYPIKSVIIVAFVFLALQGCSEIIKNIAILLGTETQESEVSQ